jgi:hypothetical protein
LYRNAVIQKRQYRGATSMSSGGFARREMLNSPGIGGAMWSMPVRRLISILASCLLFPACGGLSPRPVDGGAMIAPLINPVKLAALGKRGANPRLQKAEVP